MNLPEKPCSLYDRFGIVLFCFGYFAAYVPYSMMTKMATKGLFGGMQAPFTGFEIQPLALFGSTVTVFTFFTIARWWKFATHSRVFGIPIPRPRWFTFISGLCVALQIITTTLAYTFNGISIVFAMLLMRGGLLIMAPIIDIIARRRKRKIYWPSLVAAGLSLGALFVAFASKASTMMTAICAIDIAIYLFVYFFRLLFMSNRAKSDDMDEAKGYLVEEQTVANPVMLGVLFIIGLVGANMAPDSIPNQVWRGFSAVPFSGYFIHIFLIGMFSYGTGLFGGLIYLDRRENTFCVPANRVSSIIAGVVSTYLLATVYGQRYPDKYQLIGVGIIIFAILFLSYRSIMEKRASRCNPVS